MKITYSELGNLSNSRRRCWPEPEGYDLGDREALTTADMAAQDRRLFAAGDVRLDELLAWLDPATVTVSFEVEE